MRLGPAAGTTSRPFWVLALIIGSGTLGMHVLAPVLPLIGADFAVDPSRAQLVVSAYMFALAAGQLVHGPLSDRFGRRPVLLAGLAVYVVAGMVCVLAPTFETLLLARVLQAFGGCAGLVIGRSIVQDTSKGGDAASTIGALNTVLLVSPAVAPVLGLWLGERLGWRFVPLILVLFGSIAWLGTLFLISETGAARAERARDSIAAYGQLLVSGRFMARVFAGSLTTTTMFGILATSPFIVTRTLGRPLSDAGLFYAVLVGGIFAGSLSATRLARRFQADRQILLAASSGLAGSLLLMLGHALGQLTATLFVAAGFLYTFMSGLMAPLALTQTVAMVPTRRGTATGLFGFSQIFAGAVSVTLSGLASDVVLSTGLVMLVCSGVGLATLLALRVRTSPA